MTSLHDAMLDDAMLDDARWPAASTRIDEAGGLRGNHLHGRQRTEGRRQGRLRSGCTTGGQRREDLEREHLENYHPTDERVPRFRQLPGGRLVHVKDLYTAEELKASPTYNEALPLAVRAVRPVEGTGGTGQRVRGENEGL